MKSSARTRLPDRPAWAWRSALAAAAVTAGLFALLPMIEGVPPAPAGPVSLRPVETRPAPPPPPAPPAPPPPPREEPRRLPPPPPPPLQPVARWRPAPPEIEFGPGDLAVDFTTDFPVGRPVAGAERPFDRRDVDAVPRPLAQLPPQYPAAARLRRAEGFVILEFVVRADGRTGEVLVLSERPEGLFAEAAVRAVQRWRFHPGRLDGNPVPVRVRQRIEFRLDG